MFFTGWHVLTGLRPNMKKVKTEILLDLRGKNMLHVKRTIVEHEYQIKLTTDMIEEPLQVVQKYKHLGTVLAINGNIAPDLRQKFAAAHDTLTRYKQQLFSNRGLPLVKKVQLLEALVISAITLNCATWQPVTKKQQDRPSANWIPEDL